MSWVTPEVSLEQRRLEENSIGWGGVAVVGILVGAAAFVYCQERFGTGLRITWDGWRPTSIGCG